MNEIKVFENSQFGEIRTTVIDGEPWFVAADVCRVLEIGNPTMAILRLEEDEKALISIEGLSRGNDTGNIINEPGLYALVLGSRKPEARVFKRWITHDVIPAIRCHGGYMTPEKVEEALLNPDTLIQLATTLKQEREARQLAEVQKQALAEKVTADAPKVLFADSVTASKNSILIGELAKLMRQNGFDIGEKRLFDRLRRDGYLCSSRGERWNMPTQRALDMGLFELKKSVISNPDGSVRTTRTTKVTGKGQIYFINKYIGAEKAV